MDCVPDPAAFDTVARRGPSAFAWEVLRRNRAYRTAARMLLKLTHSDLAADPAFVADWGCTFPEDPDQTCAQVLPLWSAAVDPRVIAVRAVDRPAREARAFDLASYVSRICREPEVEHIALDIGSAAVRLDVIEGTLAAGPVALHFDVPDDGALETRLRTIQMFRIGAGSQPRYERLARRLLALPSLDAKETGASLREIAEIVLGPGDWPGDGEHRKSRVRRLLDDGLRMVRAGPQRILALTGAPTPMRRMEP